MNSIVRSLAEILCKIPAQGGDFLLSGLGFEDSKFRKPRPGALNMNWQNVRTRQILFMEGVSGYSSEEKTDFFALRLEDGNGLFVKAGEFLCSQPIALIRDDAVGEVSALFEDFQACFNG